MFLLEIASINIYNLSFLIPPILSSLFFFSEKHVVSGKIAPLREKAGTNVKRSSKRSENGVLCCTPMTN